MTKFSHLAAATAALMFFSGYALAQSTPATGAGTDAPAQNTEPAATTAPAATTTPSTAQSDPGTTDKKAAPKKKKTAKKMTRQQEIDRSIETGTVPARYRSSVPKQYHQYIPFAKQ
jgi:hypothetical protein